MPGSLIGALRITLGLDTARFDRGLSQAQRQLVKFGKDLNGIGQRMADIGQSLSTKVTLPILAVGAGVLKMAGDFESAMNKVEAATGAAGKELKALRDQAKAFGADKRFTATASQTAEAMELLAKNGLTVSQILGGATEATLKLAAATGSDFAPAADLATDIMQQFGKNAGDLQGVVDKVTGSLIASKFGFDDYRLAVGQAGGVAGGLGVSFEDFNVALTATASLFASGSDAGTSFKTFLTSLTPTSKEAAGIMKQLGLDFFDAQGKMKPLADIAQLLKDKLGGLADEAQTQALTKIFGRDAMRTAIGLMNQGADGIARINEEINKASAQAQMEARMKGLSGGLTQLRKSAESLAIALGDSGFLTAAAKFVDAITGMIRTVAQLPPPLLKLIGIFAAVAATIGPVIFVVGRLVGAWGAMLTLGGRLGPAWAGVGAAIAGVAAKIPGATRAFVGLRLAMAFLMGPWGLAIGAITLALGYLIVNSRKAAQASAEHRVRSEQLTKAQDVLRGITDRLAIATGEERKAALAATVTAARKAIVDLRAAKAAMARALAERQLAAALASQQASAQQFAAMDPRMPKSLRGPDYAAASRTADANLLKAIENTKTAMASLDLLSKALAAPVAPSNDNTPGANPTFGGDTGKKDRSARDNTEQLLKERLRLQFEMQQFALEGQREIIDAQMALTHSYQGRAQLAREGLDVEKQLRDLEVDFNLAMIEADSTVSKQQKEEARIRAEKEHELNAQVIALRRQAVNEEEVLESQRQAALDSDQSYEIRNNLLQAELGLATTASERRRIELQILELAYREKRERLQRIIQESKDADERRRAQIELDSLDAKQALETEATKRGTQGPIESYLDKIPNTADEMNEALEKVAANGLQSLEDGLMGIIDGTKSVKEAFHDMAKAILADLIRIQIQKMIMQALSSIGGFSSGGDVSGHSLGGAPGFASGGSVFGPGTGKSDSILARLSHGEYVLNAGAVSKFGTPFLDAINKGKIGPELLTGGMSLFGQLPSEAKMLAGGLGGGLGGVPFAGLLGGLLGFRNGGAVSIPGFASGGAVNGNIALPMPRIAPPEPANDYSSQVALTFNNDFRGADPSSVAAIQNRLNRMEAELPARVVHAYQDARSRFVIRQ